MKHLVLAFALSATAATVAAAPLAYTPINPSFGGNPGNGVVLLNEAQAENNIKDPATASALDARSALAAASSSAVGGGGGGTVAASMVDRAGRGVVGLWGCRVVGCGASLWGPRWDTTRPSRGQSRRRRE